MKKRILSLALVIVMGLTACGSKPSEPASTPGGGSDTSAPPAEKISVRIATQHPEDYPSSTAMLKLAEDLKERSGGILECDVYTNNALGGELDILDQTRTGSVDIIYCSPTAATMNPKINVFDLPFLFDSYEQVEKVVSNEELMNEILGDFINFGIRPMAAYENGLRVVSSNKKVESLADMKGMKMRVPQAPISIAIFNALGCNATPVAFNELYSALQQKVVDGQENGYPTFSSNKYYEVQNFIAETYHMWSINELFVSEVFWQKLTPELQEIVQTACEEAGVYQRNLYREMQDGCKQDAIDNGVEITYPDMAEWKEATASVYEDFYKEYPEWGEELVEKIRTCANS
jgi:tripartite ATP-independent transporter DctP family solute receptor